MTAQPASDVNGSQSDAVHHPEHYNSHPSGVECIEYAELLPANLSHACVYVWRHANKGTPIEDLEKALWFIDRERGVGRAQQSSSRAVLGMVAFAAGPEAALLDSRKVRIEERLRHIERFVTDREFVALTVDRLLRYELTDARELVTKRLEVLRSKGLDNAPHAKCDR